MGKFGSFSIYALIVLSLQFGCMRFSLIFESSGWKSGEVEEVSLSCFVRYKNCKGVCAVRGGFPVDQVSSGLYGDYICLGAKIQGVSHVRTGELENTPDLYRGNALRELSVVLMYW